MTLQEIAPSLHALPRMDKIMALQLLSADLADTEANPLIPGGFYPLYTPEVAPGAEEVLMKMLGEDHAA